MCFLEWKTWNFTDRLSLKSNLIRSIGSYFIKIVFLLNCSCILVSILEWFSWNLYRLITETCSVVTITNYKKNNNLIEFGSRLKVYWICKNRFFFIQEFSSIWEVALFLRNVHKKLVKHAASWGICRLCESCFVYWWCTKFRFWHRECLSNCLGQTFSRAQFWRQLLSSKLRVEFQLLLLFEKNLLLLLLFGELYTNRTFGRKIQE